MFLILILAAMSLLICILAMSGRDFLVSHTRCFRLKLIFLKKLKFRGWGVGRSHLNLPPTMTRHTRLLKWLPLLFLLLDLFRVFRKLEFRILFLRRLPTSCFFRITAKIFILFLFIFILLSNIFGSVNTDLFMVFDGPASPVFLRYSIWRRSGAFVKFRSACRWLDFLLLNFCLVLQLLLLLLF